MKSANTLRAHILLIDDEYPICIGVCGLLETYGFTADYALSAEEGMQYLEGHPETDVVLLDINLGAGTNGIEALPVIRERFKYVQVMMFTSHDSLSTGLECMKKGACDYLTKPFNEQEFLKKIPDALTKKQMAKLNELYLGILVHDLNNPLQSILGAWELAKTYLPEQLTEGQKCIIETCDSGIFQIRGMIENILSVSKFEAGTVAISKGKFSLVQEVEATLAPLRKQILSSSRTISVFYKENAPHFLVSDKALFLRVLFNLVCNAIRHTPSEGSIVVSFSEAEGDILETSVRNTGSFIEEQYRERIFDKFSSVQALQQTAGIRNFGLGLTFSKMAVEAMGGKISVEGDRNVPQTTFIYTVKNHKDI